MFGKNLEVLCTQMTIIITVIIVNIFITRLMFYKLIFGIGGIYSAYITMSVLSQRLFNTQYQSIDPNLPPVKFQYPQIIIWLGALLCAIAGSIISKVNKDPSNPIPLRERFILGGLYMANISTTNYALLYISYPIQVIGRNTRFLFVVLIGAFFSRVHKTHSHLRLGKHKIFMALIITAGVLLFNFAKASKDKGDRHNPDLEWIGYLLLTISVISDAFFSDSQAYSKANFKPTGNQLFTTTNLYTFFFSLIFSLVIDQSFFPSIQFLRNYPFVLIDLIGIGILQVLGQVSIYYVVANFKQHMFPLISTTRKMITILISIFLFNHTINQWQWIAIGIVFLGMFYQLYEEIVKGAKKGASNQKLDSSDKQIESSPQKGKHE